MKKKISRTNIFYDDGTSVSSNRREQCIMGLEQLGNATANELALHLFGKGILPYFSRNFVHPRLKELEKDGKVITVGHKVDSISNKMCHIYALTNEHKNTNNNMNGGSQLGIF